METLRRLLEQRGVTRDELAEMVGVSRQTVSGWITGKSDPSPANVFRLEEVLKLRAGTLSRDFGFLPLRAEFLPTTVEEILELLPDLDERGRRVLINVYEVVRVEH